MYKTLLSVFLILPMPTLAGAPPIFQPHGMQLMSWRNAQIVQRALDVLFDACPAMRSYLPQITSSNVQIFPVDATITDPYPFIGRHHWHNVVTLDMTVKIGGPASKFPKPAHGDTLSFEFLMGAGDDPGLYIADDRSVVQATCGAKNVQSIRTAPLPSLNMPADKDYFVSIPAMRVLAKLR